MKSLRSMLFVVLISACTMAFAQADAQKADMHNTSVAPAPSEPQRKRKAPSSGATLAASSDSALPADAIANRWGPRTMTSSNNSNSRFRTSSTVFSISPIRDPLPSAALARA